ncbi:porin family protein [Aquimarina sp. 2201CG14-23]|uniref:porin family protein n=1 Tax=Aquimarina mycalae TaxID=3040073 RepID=UPI0024782168|nr:porin family protein [Aquimarina sp. 2201CG14-23]MDH7445827.1 porin family protein [Aquimarina sp. 2201CG14-23]
MKKLFLLAIVLIGFTTISNAQSFDFGIKGGVNFANIDSRFDTDARTGFHIGAVATVGIGSKFAIQPEVLYSAQGTDDLKVDYINVPILVKYKFLKFLSFEAGPQFGIAVNDDYEIGEPETFDLSAAVGAGVKFGKFFSQLRYNYGFTDVRDGVGSQNRTFQLSVGYYIF